MPPLTSYVFAGMLMVANAPFMLPLSSAEPAPVQRAALQTNVPPTQLSESTEQALFEILETADSGHPPGIWAYPENLKDPLRRYKVERMVALLRHPDARVRKGALEALCGT